MKCPECKSENIVKERNEVYCGSCGLILSTYYIDDDNYNTNNYPLNDSVEMNTTLTKMEKKHGYDSRAAQRFRRFKSDYFDLLEEILLKEGYKYVDIPNIFYNHFIDWYYSRKDKNGNRKRKDVVYDFLIRWEV